MPCERVALLVMLKHDSHIFSHRLPQQPRQPPPAPTSAAMTCSASLPSMRHLSALAIPRDALLRLLGSNRVATTARRQQHHRAAPRPTADAATSTRPLSQPYDTTDKHAVSDTRFGLGLLTARVNRAAELTRQQEASSRKNAEKAQRRSQHEQHELAALQRRQRALSEQKAGSSKHYADLQRKVQQAQNRVLEPFQVDLPAEKKRTLKALQNAPVEHQPVPRTPATPTATSAWANNLVSVKTYKPEGERITKQTTAATTDDATVTDLADDVESSAPTIAANSYILPSHSSDSRIQYYIDNTANLNTLCQQLQHARSIAIDTEFLTGTNYYASLQLMQLATESTAQHAGLLAIIDCQALSDRLDPLLDVLFRSNVELIAHAAHSKSIHNHVNLNSDLAILHRLAQQRLKRQFGTHASTNASSLPANVFDTQLAADLLGHNRIGLGKLYKAMLDLDVDKSDTMSDWSRRPLTVKQVSYALNDVRHLHQVRHLLHQQLKEVDRLDWYKEASQYLISPSTYALTSPSEAWRTEHRYLHKLEHQSVELTTFMKLCEWRETMARSDDVLPAYMIRTELLAAIALQQPRTIADIERIQGIRPFQLVKFGPAMLHCVKSARATPAEQHVQHRFVGRDSGRMKISLYYMLMAFRAARSEEMKLAPEVLAPHDDLVEIASVSRAAITAFFQQNAEAGDAQSTYTSNAKVHPAIFSTVYKQPPAVNVEAEVDALKQLSVLSGWRLDAIGDDLLDIADSGYAMQWGDSGGIELMLPNGTPMS